MTRKVRTPAGVKFFHAPVGTPIGGARSGKRITVGTRATHRHTEGSLAELRSELKRAKFIEAGVIKVRAESPQSRREFGAYLPPAMAAAHVRGSARARTATIRTGKVRQAPAGTVAGRRIQKRRAAANR